MQNAECLTELLLEYADQNALVTPENRAEVLSSAMRIASYLADHGVMVIRTAVRLPPRPGDRVQHPEPVSRAEQAFLERHAA